MSKNQSTTGGPALNLPWAGKRVHIGEVDPILSSLWKMSADNMRIGANLYVRTSVLNLVICTPDVESAHYASKSLRDLSSTHLARATIAVLDCDAQTPDTLDSWVTLRCFSMISDLMRHCFEQTTLLTSGQASLALSNTLSLVLKAHLPSYLWWIGDTTGANHTIFRDVAALCQRVIVDSATFFHPEQDIHALADYCRSFPEVALSDLNWGRLTPWRQLIAQFFDVPEYLPFLAGVESIEIEHTAAPLATPQADIGGSISPNPTSALLLAGWLKSRLKLDLLTTNQRNQQETASGTYQWALDLPEADHQASIQLRPSIQSDVRPGSLSLVRLTCKSAERRAIFTVTREPGTDYVLTSVELARDSRPTRMVNLPARLDESELLRNELEIMGHDYFFEEALQEVDTLLQSGA